MTLPDTFACGQFNLPIQVAKLARLADDTKGPERMAAQRQLWKRGYFLDRVGIIWTLDELKTMQPRWRDLIQKDPVYQELSMEFAR